MAVAEETAIQGVSLLTAAGEQFDGSRLRGAGSSCPDAHGRAATCCSCCPRRSRSLRRTAPCNRGSSVLSSPQSGRRRRAGASTSRARTRRRACRARSPPQTSGCATTRIGPQGTARAGTPPPCSRRRPHTAARRRALAVLVCPGLARRAARACLVFCKAARAALVRGGRAGAGCVTHWCGDAV